jgi:hypothetical protein
LNLYKLGGSVTEPILDGPHARNHVALLDDLFVSFPSNLRLSKGLEKRLSNTATKRPKERKAFIYKHEGGPNSLQTPTPLGEPQEDATNIRCTQKNQGSHEGGADKVSTRPHGPARAMNPIHSTPIAYR